MCAYFSKSENEVSEAMKQAAKEAFNSNKTNVEQMWSIARACARKREGLSLFCRIVCLRNSYTLYSPSLLIQCRAIIGPYHGKNKFGDTAT